MKYIKALKFYKDESEALVFLLSFHFMCREKVKFLKVVDIFSNKLRKKKSFERLWNGFLKVVTIFSKPSFERLKLFSKQSFEKLKIYFRNIFLFINVCIIHELDEDSTIIYLTLLKAPLLISSSRFMVTKTKF